MIADPSVQAEKVRELQPWGEVLGTRCGSVENRSYPGAATKRAICWPFRSPLTDSNRRPPPYHALSAAAGSSRKRLFAGTIRCGIETGFASGCHRLRPLVSTSAPSSGGRRLREPQVPRSPRCRDAVGWPRRDSCGRRRGVSRDCRRALSVLPHEVEELCETHTLSRRSTSIS